MAKEKGGRKDFFTEKETLQILLWKSKGDSLNAIAKKLGPGNTKNSVHKFLQSIKDGTRGIRSKYETYAEERERLRKDFLASDGNVSKIAQERGVTRTTIAEQLDKVGIGAKERARFRKTGTIAVPERRLYFTEEQIKRMLAMKERDATDAEIADEIGGTTTRGSVSVTLSKLRNEKRGLKSKHETSREKSERMADAYLAKPEVSTRSLAREHGITQPAIVHRLKSVGVDGEIKDEYRKPVRA